MKSQPVSAAATTTPDLPVLPAPTGESNGSPAAKTAASPNGAPGHKPSGSSRPRGRKSRARLLVVLAVLAVLGVGAWLAYGYITRTFGAPRTDLVTHTVRREKIQVTIVERGALESQNNNDITCRVK